MNFYKSVFHIVFFVLASICLSDAHAQEQLRPLSGNINLPVIPRKHNAAAKTSTVSIIDTIPFFDDFSYAYKSPYPTVKHWLDSNAYVNTGFAIAPMSLGVATFDGLNKKGYPYNLSAPVSNSGSADTLTSLPINLENHKGKVYSPVDSIYLSFYYQAEGNGDSPEPNDSLCVDFLQHINDTTTKWVKVWGKAGYNPGAADTSFYKVMLPIKNLVYFDSLFQFRFRNKATQSGSLDHWHVDYVYINTLRHFNDSTAYGDGAFAYMPTSFLRNYSVMPYRQYDTTELAYKFTTRFRANFDTKPQMTYEYKVYDKNNPTPFYSETVFSNVLNGVPPFYSATNPVLTNTLFTSPLPDSTYYRFEHILGTSLGDKHRPNDTLVHIQRFSDYYAYDDGSAEVGYYHNQYGAKTAVRYQLNIADTLKAIKIFFDPIVDGQIIQGSSFRLMVWNGGSGAPGSVVYRDSLTYPVYLQGNYNLVPTYTLTSCLPLPAGTYFFGIQQTTNKGLNIGFDKNTNHLGSLYYDIGNGWTPSAIKGSIMINPVMGCTVSSTVSIAEHERNNFLNLFPNPAQNSLTIKSSMEDIKNMTLEIRSTLGQTVFSSEFENNQTIDISSLPNGIYFVCLNNKEQNVTPKKLIISR